MKSNYFAILFIGLIFGTACQKEKSGDQYIQARVIYGGLNETNCGDEIVVNNVRYSLVNLPAKYSTGLFSDTVIQIQYTLLHDTLVCYGDSIPNQPFNYIRLRKLQITKYL